MKLAEAKIRVKAIRETIDDLKSKVTIGSLSSISSTLNEISTLATEERSLRKSIGNIEYNSSISGSCIKELEVTVEMLEEQIDIFRGISKRKDLPENLVSLVFTQLDSFVKTKSQLQSALQKAYWEIDIL